MRKDAESFYIRECLSLPFAFPYSDKVVSIIALHKRCMLIVSVIIFLQIRCPAYHQTAVAVYRRSDSSGHRTGSLWWLPFRLKELRTFACFPLIKECSIYPCKAKDFAQPRSAGLLSRSVALPTQE